MITPRQTELLKKLKTLKHKNEVSNDCSKKKVIGYLYRHSINFLPNDKINPDFPKSNKFLQNLIHIHTNNSLLSIILTLQEILLDLHTNTATLK